MLTPLGTPLLRQNWQFNLTVPMPGLLDLGLADLVLLDLVLVDLETISELRIQPITIHRTNKGAKDGEKEKGVQAAAHDLECQR
jgi:hypothetical protein